MWGRFFGYPKVGLREGLEKTIEYFVKEVEVKHENLFDNRWSRFCRV
jgi:hypothetical protein